MRIRKQASKLLGWSCLSPFPSSSSSSAATPAARCWSPPPPPPPLKAVAGAGTGELQCQLNLSPWDAGDHYHHHGTNSEDELESANEVIGVLGNGMEAKEEETIIMCDVPEVREYEMEEEKVMNDKEEKRPMRKRREKETEPAVIMKCKKTDGKGWHCKRDAQLPHTLCSYHLAQLRSYRTRFEEEVSDDDHRGGGNDRRRKKSAPVVEAGGASTNYYYYYSVLGPWWGKRRGPVDAINGGSNESRENSESDDGSEHSSPVAAVHDEAHDDRGIDDEDDGQERDDRGNSCSYKQRIEDGVKKKKKNPVKKRGRKPVKARSLKSLL